MKRTPYKHPSISSCFSSINIINGKPLWFHRSFLDLFFSKVKRMLKRAVEITSLHNKASPQDVMSCNGFSDTFYSSVLSQFLTLWLTTSLCAHLDKCWISIEMVSAKTFVSITYCSMCLCRCGTWQTYCLETVGDKDTLCLFHRPLNLPPSRGSGNMRAERGHEVKHMHGQFNNFKLQVLCATIR